MASIKSYFKIVFSDFSSESILRYICAAWVGIALVFVIYLLFTHRLRFKWHLCENDISDICRDSQMKQCSLTAYSYGYWKPHSFIVHICIVRVGWFGRIEDNARILHIIQLCWWLSHLMRIADFAASTQFNLQNTVQCPQLATNTIRSRVDSHITTTYREFYRFLDALKFWINFNSDRTHIRTWSIVPTHPHIQTCTHFSVIHIFFFHQLVLSPFHFCLSFVHVGDLTVRHVSYIAKMLFVSIFFAVQFVHTVVHYVQKCHKNKS